ncbi:hypothetical protein BKA62DRAFT_687089 [Auriculariales sp. MPI-PUGE-AT-0066]|nr:hypothetical protein BKA62DRAFT_687089 [Auriculariales sp. MPI-PUGE-AT-0066]
MAARPLRVGYVHEHFSSPLLKFAAEDGGKTFALTGCPGGTGQLTAALANDEIDVAIALTDALIAGIAKGAKHYNLVGSYVASSLNWAVIAGRDTEYKSIQDLRGTTIGISRPGSGSQTMAGVMAMQQGWVNESGLPEAFEFKTCQDINGLIAAVNRGECSAFMWEWFTTKPRMDAGEVRFIGSVPTPWPSWLIAGSTDEARAPAGHLRDFLATLTRHITAFQHEKDTDAAATIAFIREHFEDQKEEDIQMWLNTVKYAKDCTAIDGKLVVDTLTTLEKAGVVERPPQGFDVLDFINKNVVRVTPTHSI